MYVGLFFRSFYLLILCLVKCKGGYLSVSIFVQVPLNLTGVRAVRPLLLTPANYSQVDQTLLKLNLPSQAAEKQQPEPASVEGTINFECIIHHFIWHVKSDCLERLVSEMACYVTYVSSHM